MELSISLESQNGFLWGTATGRVTLQETLDGYKKAIDTATKRHLNRILIDASSAEGELTDLERYKLGRDMAAYCLRKSAVVFKVATVGKPPLVTGFGAQVARNRGLTADTFSELKKAIVWLDCFK